MLPLSRYLALGVLALVFPLSAAICGAQEPRPPERRAAPIELNFQDAELRIVLSALAEVSGLNVVYSNLPSRTVTLRTSRAISAAEARAYLESVVRSNGLTMTDEGGLLRISGEPVAVQAAAPPPTRTPQDRVQLFVYRLQHAQAADLAGTLADLFGLSRPAAGAEDASPQSLSEVMRSQQLPQRYTGEPARVAERPVAGGAVAAPAGLTAALQGTVQIVPDPRTNSLLLRASPADYETMRQAIRELDVRPLQVMIEVLIAEVRRDRQLGAGLNVTVPSTTVGRGDTQVGGELLGGSAGDVAIRILNIGGVNAAAVLRLLATSSDVTILSRPIVMAQNNEEARILVGSERPFIQLFRSLPTENAVRDQIVQYRDVGTQLTIRPTINPDGYVSLSVLQEVSNATAETQFGAPVISTREVKTQLLIRDGHTAVIGGLIDHQREVGSSGVPFLKDIPLIGGLFRSTQQRRATTTELFLFLTPHVLRTDTDIDNATQGLRDGTTELRKRVHDPIPILRPDSTRRVPPAGAPAPTP